ncbi:hypothetical protein [Ferrimonas balearica]|uniref:hypothetical protein n=1 Tax=Ferrimonas balearica TaxID=44012 RepID=UPI001C991173|nr:hypothetical protein [Ferrimonas balearica]MBY5991490.1 hypothetical protein [Ferrimonas balearica]
MSNRFYLVTIGPAQFEGMVSADGPHIKRLGGASVAVGEAQLHLGDPLFPGWRLVDQHHSLTLEDLSESEVLTLAEQFGLPMRTAPTETAEPSRFWQSPAFAGLCDWVRHHGTKAAHQVRQHHQRTPGWLEMCQAANELADETRQN